MIERVGRLECITLTAPHWWADPDFLLWLNHRNTATWHAAGEEPDDFSDCFILYDNGEGSDAPWNPDRSTGDCIPSHLWEELTQFLEAQGIRYCIVWLLPYDRDQPPMSEHQKMQLLQSWQERHSSDSSSD